MALNELISIIIPMYNAEKYISETLDSVLTQTYENFECIIVNDGSSDSSCEIALSYCKKDKRLKYFSQVNSGPSSARNYGVIQSKGSYIQYLDADDIILPDRLSIMMNEAAKADNSIIYYSDLLLGKYDNIHVTSHMNLPASTGGDIDFKDMLRQFAIDFIFIPSCVFFPREVIDNINWDETLGYSEDWDYYLRILRNNFVFRFISTPLIIYRNTPDSLSKDINNTIKANYKILSKWFDRRNGFSFSSRAAQLYQKSIVLYILNNNKKIIKPRFHGKKKSLWICFFILLIFPITIYYLIAAFFKAIIKKF
jgi:glycosyltransferase involved in cell wall biosynthesis